MAYAARAAGRVPSWAPLPVQYIDYTLWQRAQFGDLDDPGSVIGAQLAWEQALAGMAEQVVCPRIGRIRWWLITGRRGGGGVAC